MWTVHVQKGTIDNCSGVIIMGFQWFTGHQNPTLPKIAHHLQQEVHIALESKNHIENKIYREWLKK